MAFSCAYAVQTMISSNLDALFAPNAIALIGASNETRSVGAILARNLFSAGFSGPVMPVNPHEDAIRSAINYRTISDLPAPPDLAVVATPPDTVASIVNELGARGCRAAIIVTADVDEVGRRAMLRAAQPYDMRIVGPNCLGVLSPRRGLNASFAHNNPEPGDIAFVTQSGAIATAMLDWAAARGVGFSHVVSLGDMSDVDFGDVLAFLADDCATKAILLYCEGVSDARKFMATGAKAAFAKPVIVVKSGRSEAAARAAATHTGALAGSDAVHDAVFRRLGMVRVDTFRDLFNASAMLVDGSRAKNERLVVLTNGGGLGVLAVDAASRHGVKLAELSPKSCAALDRRLPDGWSQANPIDIRGDATGRHYRDAVEVLRDDPQCGAILAMNAPTGVADNCEAAQAVVEARTNEVPLFGVWMGEATAAASRQVMTRAGAPNFETPDEAVRAFRYLIEYSANQELLREEPIHQPRDKAARAPIETALSEGRETLTLADSLAVLEAYGVRTVATRVATTPEEAAAAADNLDCNVALKIDSPDISHKSDVGGVKLGLSPAEVRSTAEEMLKRVARAVPDARIKGFTVQPMSGARAEELIVGASQDDIFGPVILVGRGGVRTEVLDDRVIGLPPLNRQLARDMICRTRAFKLLQGYRDRAPADLNAIASVLVAVSDLMLDAPEVAALDINPLLASDEGSLAVDARIVLRRPRRR